jgi:phosphotriesterase-related protein
VARSGAWVEFDGIGFRGVSMDWIVECVQAMKDAGLLARTLISQDAGWYEVDQPKGQPKGGSYRGYTLVFSEFVPRLKGIGFTDDEIDRLLIRNPAEALGGQLDKGGLC